jgi:hypothetical protein
VQGAARSDVPTTDEIRMSVALLRKKDANSITTHQSKSNAILHETAAGADVAQNSPSQCWFLVVVYV